MKGTQLLFVHAVYRIDRDAGSCGIYCDLYSGRGRGGGVTGSNADPDTGSPEYFVVFLTQSAKISYEFYVLSNLSAITLYSFGSVLRATEGTIKLTTKKENKDIIRFVSSTFWEPGSAVCTVAGLRPGRPGVRVAARVQKKILSSPKRPDRSLEPHQPPIQWVTRFFSRVK